MSSKFMLNSHFYYFLIFFIIFIIQVAIRNSCSVTFWRSELSNVSLVILDKLIFVKSIIDGAVKVESLLITDNMSSKVVSFF